MKVRTLCVVTLLAIAASSASAQTPPPGNPVGGAWVDLLEYSYISSGPDAGNYEYIYDIYGGDGAGSNTFIMNWELRYDGSEQVNVWAPNDGATNLASQVWCAESAGHGVPYNGDTNPHLWPSNWEDTNGDFVKDSWVPAANDWAMVNTWHDGTEYNADQHCWHAWDIDANGWHFYNANGFIEGDSWMQDGLTATLRVVHPYGPGDMEYKFYFYEDPDTGATGDLIGTVLGPMVEPSAKPGDFNNDTFVNAVDIDLLADAIEAGSSDSQFDVNGDTFIDEQDLIDHIATLVERTDGGVGTYRGDFNLDGFVNGTDLAIFKASFGLSGMGFAQGNANADDFVNGTDLAIFKAVFGFSGTPGDGGNPPAVPEPATMSLLALGGVAALIRRRK
jgi:hypothetical protein